LHSNFVAKDHKSQVHPRSIDDMHFACCAQNFANVYKWHAFGTLHSTKCKTLNLKCHELHLYLTLSLIFNQSYATMHRLHVEYAYAYSYYAYLGISICECPNVHISMGNFSPNMDEHQLLHDRSKLDMTTCISEYYPGSYPEFLIYWGNIGFYLFKYEHVFDLFPPSPLCFPSSQCVLQHVPNSTSLYFISFALSFTLVTYVTNPKGGDYNISIWVLFKAWIIFFCDQW